MAGWEKPMLPNQQLCRDAMHRVFVLIILKMKRIKVNTTWEEDEEEQLRFFASLSYSERLRLLFKLREATNPQKQPAPQRRIFKLYRSHDELR